MNRPPHRQEEDVSLMPLSASAEEPRHKARSRERAGETPTDRHDRRGDYRGGRDRNRNHRLQRVLGAHRPAARTPAASIGIIPRCVCQGTPRLVWTDNGIRRYHRV